MRQKVIAAALAGGLALGAGLIALTVATPGIANAQDDQNPEETSERTHDRHGAILEEVLDDLVAAGQISQEQAEVIIESLASKAEEIRAAREASGLTPPQRGQLRRGVWLGALLDDGGIDQAEYDGLPDIHPLKQSDVSQYLEDGVITFDELREIRESQSQSGDAA
ncbi:MAG TPA: hypothetical protein VIW94_04410 [Acidimicrobiia bacterium]